MLLQFLPWFINLKLPIFRIIIFKKMYKILNNLKNQVKFFNLKIKLHFKIFVLREIVE